MGRTQGPEPLGRIKRLSPSEVRALSRQEFMHLSDDEVRTLTDACDRALQMVERLDDYPEHLPPVKYAKRDRGRRPSAGEDPHNIFIRRCLVRGAPSGKLLGKRVGLKDNIALQGIPMTNASRLAETYVPRYDATVVTRILDAGAVIVGKLNMDDFSFGTTSETSAFGPVRNPLNPEYSPGGSSSGSGAAVANNDVDLAIGVDQGGSARIPASCTGVVSIKPTHGLVPSFGIAYWDHTFDYVCPIARTVKETAVALEVMAGTDGNDPQWVRGPVKVEEYSRSLKSSRAGLSSLKVGYIEESLTWENTDPEIKEAFLATLRRLGELGIRVKKISIPSFQVSSSIATSILMHSIQAMVESSGEGYWHGGFYNASWCEHLGRARRAKADLFPPALKVALILGRYLRGEYFSVYHAKAQNLRGALSKEVDRALDSLDVLLTPTMIAKPPRLEQKAGLERSLRRGASLNLNTQPFNLTGHPAITVPCASRGGLPVSIQLVARRFAEATLFRVADAFENSFDWKTL